MANEIKINVEFGGGTELLFDKQKSISVQLETTPQNTWTISELIRYLREEYIKERADLFASGDKIRPGILILVNDVDYEILGGDNYVLNDGDTVLFISTLHGG